ncbi:MAG: NitT/TauT family transport system ATP-binding protein [Rhodospirillaceae bacterium]|nr:NitT/TauT family transport system ATP-binding protein [Rhodospirillaceae bacterium]
MQGEDDIAQEPLIAATGVSKTYRTVSGGRVNAIAGIDLMIDDGDFVCIVGPSGCGKSSFLRLVAGLDTVSAGTLTLAGDPVRGPSREVGMVFQNATLLPWMSVAENVALPLRLGSGKSDDTFVRSLLAMVGLAGFADKYPYELSGGMQQRAAICRALVRDPKVLLMDEPFGALDALTRERMNVELQRIWQASRKTVLLITHSIAESIFLGDRVIVMSPRPGRILEDFRIDLPRPRNFSETTGNPEYLRLTREIRAALDATAGEDAA